MTNITNHRILMIENDPDDRCLTEEVFRSEGITAAIDFLYSNGLPDHLRNLNYIPRIIMISLNAQANDLEELMTCIRNNRNCRTIPVIVLSDVVRPEDVQKCYALGANSLIKKPDTYTETLFKIKTFINYWFGTVELPV